MVVALTLLMVAVALRYRRTATPRLRGELSVPFVQRAVEIGWDSLDVPHVRAQSERDVLFAQGYLHATERLWQMELLRRVASGRLSEILGRATIDSDRYLRTVGFSRIGAATLAQLSANDRALLDAYVAGINARIEGDPTLPPEFVVLRFRPERWTAEHSLSIGAVMSWDLTIFGEDAAKTEAVRLLDTVRARALFPDYPTWAPLIMRAAAVTVPPIALQLLSAASITRASNAWVIGPTRTVSGKPILANDPHLALRAPSLWYLMALHAPELSVAGVSLPGLPYIVLGRNRAAAWGFTNVMLDDADLFLEQLDSTDASRYRVPGGSAPFGTLTEQIHIKGGAVDTLQIRFTRNGPVLTGVENRVGDVLVALRWAAHDASTTVQALRGFATMRSWPELERAAALFTDPHQNIVYADTTGDFGYIMSGRIPKRGDGRLPPTLPVPGWTEEWRWQGYYPVADNPRIRNPAEGFVVTANNRQIAGELGDRIGGNWDAFRALRIQQMIEEAQAPIDAAAVQRMQLDVHDAFADRHVGAAIRAAERAGLNDAAVSLQAWDRNARADSPAAAWFNVWIARLGTLIRGALYDERRGGWYSREMTGALLDSMRLTWLENGAAVLDSLAVQAARSADSVAAGQSWGDLHASMSAHALGSSTILDRVLQLNVGREAAGGSSTTVNVSSPGSSFPTVSTFGASMRHVADLADLDGNGGFILPTGQSGVPFSRHYRDQWSRWLHGGLWRVPLDSARAAAGITHTARLAPR